MTSETEAFLRALGDLQEALGRNLEMTERMQARIGHLSDELTAGRKLLEIVPAEQPPLLVQLLTESANLLHTYGTRVRRAEARAMHAEGMSTEAIAGLFGVSRQRVQALLRDVPNDPRA